MRFRTFLLMAGATAFAAYQINRLVSYLVAPWEPWELDDDGFVLLDRERDEFDDIVERMKREEDL